MVQGIDKLNTISKYKNRGVPFEKYFGEMDIPEEDKEKRIEVARKLKDSIDFLFSLLLIYASVELIEEEYLVNQFSNRCKQAIAEYVVIDDYISKHIDEMSKLFVALTISNIANEWYTSEDRAIFNAENESNVVLNYEELQEALTMGKKYKTWHTMRDRRVRHTHAMLDDKTIKIEDMFDLGTCQMMMPKDYEHGIDEEIVNCRCSISYS